jgi:hypothetical protein
MQCSVPYPFRWRDGLRRCGSRSTPARGLARTRLRVTSTAAMVSEAPISAVKSTIEARPPTSTPAVWLVQNEEVALDRERSRQENALGFAARKILHLRHGKLFCTNALERDHGDVAPVRRNPEGPFAPNAGHHDLAGVAGKSSLSGRTSPGSLSVASIFLRHLIPKGAGARRPVRGRSRRREFFCHRAKR